MKGAVGSGVLPFSGQTPSLSGPSVLNWQVGTPAPDPSTVRRVGTHTGVSRSVPAAPLPTCLALGATHPAERSAGLAGPVQGAGTLARFMEGRTETWRVKPSGVPGRRGPGGAARLQPVSEQRGAVPGGLGSRVVPASTCPARAAQQGFPRASRRSVRVTCGHSPTCHSH